MIEVAKQPKGHDSSANMENYYTAIQDVHDNMAITPNFEV